MTGFCVPHLKSVNCRVLTKYTSALNGESKPYFQPLSVDRIGMFRVCRVNVPGGNASAICPSLTKTATWDSRTISFAPILISLSCLGKRHTMVSRLSSSHSMMSTNSPRIMLRKAIEHPLTGGSQWRARYQRRVDGWLQRSRVLLGGVGKQRVAQLAYSELQSAMLDEEKRRRKAAKIIAVLEHFHGPLGGLTVADIGCSAGFIADELAAAGAKRTLGIDIDVPGLRRAADRFGERVAFVCGDGTA